MLSNNVHARYITNIPCISWVLKIKQHTRWKNVFNGKKYSSNVNNQILEQIYMDMLEKLKMEACSVQEHIQ